MSLQEIVEFVNAGNYVELDHYILTDLKGEGSLFYVFQAHENDLPNEPDYHVALKVAKPGFDDALKAHKDLMIRLRHTNIPKVTDIEFDCEIPYVVEEIADMTLLDKLESSSGFIGEEVINNYASQLFDVLEHVHSKGVVHTDINPVNVLIKDDKIYLIDFNLVQEAESKKDENLLLSLMSLENSSKERNIRKANPYWSPELIGGEDFEMRDDLYSTGVLLWLMLTGTPYHGSVVDPRQKNKELIIDYSEFFKKAFMPTREDRFQNAGEMSGFWENIYGGKGNISAALDKIRTEPVKEETDIFGGGLILYTLDHDSRLYALEPKDFSRVIDISNPIQGDLGCLISACSLPETSKVALLFYYETGDNVNHSVEIIDLNKLDGGSIKLFDTSEDRSIEKPCEFYNLFWTKEGRILLGYGGEFKHKFDREKGDIVELGFYDKPENIKKDNVSPNSKYCVTASDNGVRIINREGSGVAFFSEEIISDSANMAFWLRELDYEIPEPRKAEHNSRPKNKKGFLKGLFGN